MNIYDQEEAVDRNQIEKIKAKEGGNEKILIFHEDTSMFPFLVEQLEQRGWQVFTVSRVEKVVAAFLEIKPECLIIDVQKESGFDLLMTLNKKMKQIFIPIIAMGTDHERNKRMLAFELGADDFFVKSSDIDKLMVRVKRHIERKKVFDGVLMVDELTGVYNRKYLPEIYKQQSEYVRTKQSFCMAFIDLDEFKSFNAQYGYKAGNRVLQFFALFAKNRINRSDFIFRFGGEEFVILFPKTNVKEGEEFIRRLLQEFMTKPFNDGGHSYFSSFSVCIIQVNDEALLLDDCLKKAQKALAEAKENGQTKFICSIGGMASAPRMFRVSIIDDDPLIRTMLTNLIKKMDLSGDVHIDVQSFTDGVAFFHSDWHYADYDLVILDRIMPKMDGLEVLQRLRKEKNRDQLSVVMLSSRSSERDLEKAFELGADDYVMKPFKIKELEAKIIRFMKRLEQQC
ncbi:response regulator [Bacillus sp. 03113]|uniref:response regulator n=1 Tax=Bacillus sp. 03113 TaxID=2578211 RepID=UPI0011416D35|nr:response regulator [Bacillus sp. 03113]